MRPERLRDQVAYYARWARLYDVFTARILPLGGPRTRLARAVATEGPSTVVDMGCGTGANLPHLRRALGAGSRVVGLDATRAVLERAQEHLRRAGARDVHLVQGDATRPPFRGPVDAVVASFVVGTFPQPEEVVREWTKLVGSRGTVALLEAAESPHPSPLNPPFRAFVAATYPRATSAGPGAMLRILRERTEAARRGLASLGDVEERTFLDGLVRLLAARGVPAAPAPPESHPAPQGAVERALHGVGVGIATALFVGARTPAAVVRRLRLAYRLAGVRIERTDSGDDVERTEFLCPYRNLGAAEHGDRWVCHRKLDRVDDGYVTYLAARGIEYRRPRGVEGTERCASEVRRMEGPRK